MLPRPITLPSILTCNTLPVERVEENEYLVTELPIKFEYWLKY